MKYVVHVITGLGDGGAEKTLFKLITNISEYNHVVFTMSHYRQKYVPLLRNHGVQVYSLRTSSLLLPNISNIFRLACYFYNRKVQCIHCMMYHPIFLISLCSAILPFSIDNIVWNIRHADYHSLKYSTKFIVRFSSFFSHYIPCKIIYCSTASRILHENQLNYCSKHSLKIDNAVDSKLFAFSSDYRSSIRNQYDIDESFLIGCVGRFHPDKGQTDLLKFLNAFSLAYPNLNWKIMFVGTGMSEFNNVLIDHILSNNLDDYVILAGPHTDIHKYYSAFDLFLLPSRTESFPNTLLEALSCECLCLATDVGDVPFILGEYGFIIDLFSYNQSLKLLQELMLDHRPTNRYRSIRQREYTYTTYSVESMVKAFKTVFDSIKI